jgi:hypothetical protein
LLNILWISLACTSSLPLMLMIGNFGLLMVLLSSCVFLSQHLSLLSKSSAVFSLRSVLSSSPEILSSTCFSVLDWLSPVFLFDLRNFLFIGFLFDSFFLGFPYLC